MSSTNTIIAALSTYEVNHNAIVFLSQMVENTNGQDVSAARVELIELFDLQIELVEAKYEETWTLAQESTDTALEAKAEIERTGCPWDFQEYS